MAPPDLHAGFLTWWPFGVKTDEVLDSHDGVTTDCVFSRRGKR